MQSNWSRITIALYINLIVSRFKIITIPLVVKFGFVQLILILKKNVLIDVCFLKLNNTQGKQYKDYTLFAIRDTEYDYNSNVVYFQV